MRVYSVLHRLKRVRGRALALQLRHSMDVWQKWTLVVNLGAQHAGGGGGGGSLDASGHAV